jgi:hypothetical protein
MEIIILCLLFVLTLCFICGNKYSNDPSAGSPTETLLRLLFPLNHQVRSTLAKQPSDT